jgi:hypothetical protein
VEGRHAPGLILDVALDEARLEHGASVVVRAGGRETVARVSWFGGRFHQLRCEAALGLAYGDRFTLHAAGEGGVLDGGAVLDANARRHGTTNDALVELSRLLRELEA